MAFIKDQFKRQVERPYKQLASISALWQQRVPEDLVLHTKLDGLSHGVLHVTVDSSARLYQLDRLLRSGLEQKLILEHRGPAFRRVKLSVGKIVDGAVE